MDSLGEELPSHRERASKLSAAHPRTPVVLDFGSNYTRVGLGDRERPEHVLLTRSARFRDRKTGKQHTVVGNDILLEPNARNQVKSPFDGPLLTNWDACEQVLDYSLGLIGYEAGGEAPIAISEALLAPHLPHRTLQELLFEGYDAPKIAFGADVLAQACYHSAGAGGGASGSASGSENMLLVSVGAEATHVLPVVGGRPCLEQVRRINFGLRPAAEYLHELLVLKYPNFPTPVTRGEVEQMMRRHCLIAEDYRATVRRLPDVDFLASFERRVQAPVPQPSAEDEAERARIRAQQQQRRQESGRRLQEQTAALRAERLARQQEELADLEQLQKRISELGPDEAHQEALNAGYGNVKEVTRAVKQLSNTLRRAQGLAVETAEPETPLLSVPDEELSEEQLKEKRRQRLLRASYEARQRQKQAKEARLQHEAELARKEAEWRERDLAGWSAAKRAQLAEVLEAIKMREKLRSNPRLRFQQLIGAAEGTTPHTGGAPSITTASATAGIAAGSGGAGAAGAASASAISASAATTTTTSAAAAAASASATSTSTTPASTSAPASTSGAASGSDDSEEEEEERDYDAEASALQMQLLEHDPTFDPSELEPQIDWRDSTIHKFLWGAHPYDPENLAQQHQLNLNIERVRVLEPLFQPQIVGIDQAGLSETCVDLLNRFPQLSKNIRLSGGGANISGLAKRLETDLRRDLPANLEIKIELGSEPELDSWRGLAQWSQDDNAYISRAEYDENGPDFIKEHRWGNPYH